jgi:hypothetical protein
MTTELCAVRFLCTAADRAVSNFVIEPFPGPANFERHYLLRANFTKYCADARLTKMSETSMRQSPIFLFCAPFKTTQPRC